MSRTVEVDEDGFSRLVAEDLLWSAENAEEADIQKACLKAALYYMTFEQVAQYLGSAEEAEEYFR